MRLAPHGQTRLLSIPVDSCRFVPSRTRPLTHASPLVDATPPYGGRSLRDRQRVAVAEPPQSRVDRNRVARQADRPFLDLSAPSRWSRWSRLSRAGPEGAAGGAREVIESAEARHASGAFLPLHLSGVSSWVASRDHRDFQDDRDGPVAQAAPESIRPLTHAAPLKPAHGLARARQRSLALRRKKNIFTASNARFRARRTSP